MLCVRAVTESVVCVFVERVWQHGDNAGRPGLLAHEGRQEVVEETLLCPACLGTLLLYQRKLKGDWLCLIIMVIM